MCLQGINDLRDMQRMDIDTEYNQQDERVCTQDHGCYTQIRSNLYVCGISKMQNIDDKPWDGSWGSKIWGPSPSMMETTHGPRGPGGPGPRTSLAESKRGAQLGRPKGMGLSGSVGVKVTLWL